MRCTAGRSFGTFGQVPFHVQRQVIGAGEAALAHFAPERLGAGVFAIVARQLVAARETPLTLGPVTPVRLLSCVDSLVSFEMRALGVHFGASGKIAIVDPPLLQLWIVASVVLDGPGGIGRSFDGVALVGTGADFGTRRRRRGGRIRRWRRFAVRFERIDGHDGGAGHGAGGGRGLLPDVGRPGV